MDSFVQDCPTFFNESSCTATCNDSLTSAIAMLGCCVNIYFNLASVQAGETIGATNTRSTAEWYTACNNEGTPTCPNVYIPPPLEELIDANICYAANSSLFQDSMCAQAAQQIANDIPTGQSITTAAAAYACNDTCRNLIMSQINSCVRGDDATIQNTARRLACTYDGANSCGTRVPPSFFTQFRTYCVDFVGGADQCPTNCSSAVNMQHESLGCCLTPLFDVVWLHAVTFSGIPITTIRSANDLYSACSIVDPGQCVSTACENAQRALEANSNCASAQARSAAAYDSNSSLAESDINIVCTPICLSIIGDSVKMCTDNIVAQRGFDANSDLACRRNGTISCININVDAEFRAAAVALTPTGGQCSGFISNGTCTGSCGALITPLVNTAGCCYHQLYSLAIASQTTPTVIMRTSTQLLTACGITNPGTCSEVRGGSGGADTIKAISTLGLLMIALVIFLA
ncbi:uncharacterized protein [Dysidea avara]